MAAAFHTMDLVGNLLQLSSPTLPLHTSTILFLQEDPDFSIPLLPPSFPAAAGLIHVRREWLLPDPDHYLRSLSDRISALELAAAADEGADRKYKWTAEVKACGGLERRHRLVVEVKAGKVEEKSFKWSAKVTGKGADGPIAKTYTFRSSAAPLSVNKEKKGKKEKARVVEIEDADPAAFALKQVGEHLLALLLACSFLIDHGS